MKKLVIVAALMLTAVSAFAQTGKSLYNKYSGERGVEAVYISPAMFNLMGRIPDFELNDQDVNLSSVIESLEGMYVIDSESRSVNSKLQKEVQDLLKAKKYELIMEAKDEDETVRAYIHEKDGYIRTFIIVCDERDEYTFVCIDGKMQKGDLETIMSSVR